MVYVWPANLPDLVGEYHLRMPRHFLVHARQQGWRVPDVDVSRYPGSPTIPALTPAEVEWYARGHSAAFGATADGPLVARGLVPVKDMIRSGLADCVYRGVTRSGRSALVTLTNPQRESFEAIVSRFTYEHVGVAPLLYVGSGDGELPAELVEQEPLGRSLLEVAPMPEPDVIRVGLEVSRVLAHFHAEDRVLVGILPELVYVDDENQFTQIVPRSPGFV